MLFLEESFPELHSEDPSNEPRKTGDLEGQRQAFERSRSFVDLQTILLENRKLIRLERNFRWLRWLVRLDLKENIQRFPSLRHLNPPIAVDLPWLRNEAAVTPTKANKCLGNSFLSKEDPLQLVFLYCFVKEIHNPNSLKNEQLYTLEGFSACCGNLVIDNVLLERVDLNSFDLPDSFEELVIFKNLWLRKSPEDYLFSKENPLQRGLVLLSRSVKELLPCKFLSKKGRRHPTICHPTIFSIPGAGKVEYIDIQVFVNSCRELLKLGYHLAISVQRNPVSKVLDTLDIIFYRPSNKDMLASSMNGRETFFIFAEPRVGPVYLPREVPLQRMKYTVFLVYHRPDVEKKFTDNLLKSLRAGGIKVLDIDLNNWKIERKKCLDLEHWWERTDIHIPIVSRYCEDSFYRHLGELLRMCRSNSLIRPLLYKVKPTDALDIKTLYKTVFSELPKHFNEVSSSGHGQHQMSFQTGWSLSSNR